MANPDDEWISESLAAERLNVDRNVLRGARDLVPAGQISTKKGAVVWLGSAVRELAARLGLPLAEDHQKPPPNVGHLADAPLAEDDGSEVLSVFARTRNPHIVNALRANGEMAAVRVMSNANYQPLLRNGEPMRIRAKRSSEGNWWILIGRDPRWPGQM